jgi:hypothetical protein
MPIVRKRRRAWPGALGDEVDGEQIKFLFGILESCNPLIGLLGRDRAGDWKEYGFGLKNCCLMCFLGGRQRAAMANASCDSGQALEKAQNGNGRLLEKVGMDLGLAPVGLGSTVSQRDKSDRGRSDPATGSGAARLYCAASALPRDSSPDNSAGLPPSA